MNRLYAIISLVLVSFLLAGCPSAGVQTKNYDQNTPGDGADYVIRSANAGLMKTLSKDGEGYEGMDGRCKVSENTNGRARYRCDAVTEAGSKTFQEQQFPPARRGGVYEGPYRNDRRNSNRQCRRYDRNGRCLDNRSRSSRSHRVGVQAGASIGSGAYIRD